MLADIQSGELINRVRAKGVTAMLNTPSISVTRRKDRWAGAVQKSGRKAHMAIGMVMRASGRAFSWNRRAWWIRMRLSC